MKYIVTGGAGFVGSHVSDYLINQGHEVIVIDNLVTGKKEYLNSKAKFHQLDITDYNAIESLFRGVDGVFHLAALARIQPSFEDPDLYFRVNAIGTRNILAAAKKYGVKRVVYSASSSAYGQREDMPLHEDDKVTAQSLHPYGSTKRMGEMLMRDLGKYTNGPETVCLRYFNVYGPRQSTTLDGPYATVIGIFCDLFKRGKSLPVVPDGHQRRDFTWAGDVAAANYAAMTSPKVGNGEIINIGTKQSYSIWDVAKLVWGAPQTATVEDMLKSGKCVMAPARRGEVKETLANISRAKELLDWEPKMEFKEGIQRCLDSMK